MFRFGRKRRAFGALLGCESGASAVEFALVAPAFGLALLAAVDVGMAEHERMSVDHALRAAARTASSDPGQVQVLAVLVAAGSRNFSVVTSGAATAGTLKLTADRFCACPEAPESALACSTTCTGQKPTSIFYGLHGSKLYAGLIIPSIAVASSARVQVR
jgi:pilus assembly protein CpaE